VRSTHFKFLVMAGGQILLGHGKKTTSETHSLPGDGRERGLSEHEKETTERGALTNWRWKREGLVRTGKESNRLGERSTHFLEIAGGTCQDTERNGKKASEREALTDWRREMKGTSQSTKRK
jgi:hypothetical protein